MNVIVFLDAELLNGSLRSDSLQLFERLRVGLSTLLAVQRYMSQINTEDDKF